MDIHPDGGMSRLRLLGALTPQGRVGAGLRWFNALSPRTAATVLADAGPLPTDAVALVARRPITETTDLPAAARRLLCGPAASLPDGAPEPRSS
jgi:hypothetical protein